MAAMDLYPAIDLKQGQCVRLFKGDMDQATVFNDSPGDQAGGFVAAGAQWLHVVDLDGAFAGESVNGAAVDAIVAAAGTVPVQLGGGIRSVDAAGAWLERGISRVILGTVAVRDPQVSAIRRPRGGFSGLGAVSGSGPDRRLRLFPRRSDRGPAHASGIDRIEEDANRAKNCAMDGRHGAGRIGRTSGVVQVSIRSRPGNSLARKRWRPV